MNIGIDMISTPQEIEQTAMSVANWIVYNNRPFVLPAENNTKVYLAVLTEEQMQTLNNPPAPAAEVEE